MLGAMDPTGKRMPFTLEPGGRSSTKFDLGSGMGNPFGGEMMIPQGLQQFFIPWPRPAAGGRGGLDGLHHPGTREEWWGRDLNHNFDPLYLPRTD